MQNIKDLLIYLLICSKSVRAASYKQPALLVLYSDILTLNYAVLCNETLIIIIIYIIIIIIIYHYTGFVGKLYSCSLTSKISILYRYRDSWSTSFRYCIRVKTPGTHLKPECVSLGKPT